MPRPGTKITSFPTQPTTTLPPVQLQTTPLPGALSTLPSLPPPLPLAQQPQNIGLPPELVAEEPVSFPENMTIDELIEIRRDVGKNSPIYWAAFDEIQKKRDKMYLAHHLSQMKAIQDNTIALYTVNKMKVPETVGQPFESD